MNREGKFPCSSSDGNPLRHSRHSRRRGSPSPWLALVTGVLSAGFGIANLIPALKSQAAGTTGLDLPLLLSPIFFIVLGTPAAIHGILALAKKHGPADFTNTPIAGLKLKRQQPGYSAVFGLLIFPILVATTLLGANPNGFKDFCKVHPFDYWHVRLNAIAIGFTLLGLSFLAECIRKALLRIKSGHYDLTISCEALKPGARVSVDYSFVGNSEILNSAEFSVVERMHTQRRHGQPRVNEKTTIVKTVEGDSLTKHGEFTFTMPDAKFEPEAKWYIKVKFWKLADLFELPITEQKFSLG